MNYSTEIIRNVFDNDECVALTIGADPDGLDCVRLCTSSDAAKAYWGNIELTMPPEFARQIGMALIAAAEDALKSTQKEM